MVALTSLTWETLELAEHLLAKEDGLAHSMFWRSLLV
jgi:hypothetical protein